MKRYIWLTIYFVWLVLLSYTFFYFSNKSNNLRKIVNISQKSGNVLPVDTLSWKKVLSWSKKDNFFWEELLDSWDLNKISTWFDELYVVETNTWSNISETWNNLSTDNAKTNDTQNIIPDKIYVWLAEAKLVSGSNYDDIFSLFNLEHYPTYKISEKDIYLKQLKSIDYETEKNNINQLIQEIWGNIKEVNLFWDKQAFINPDLYYKKVVIMLVSYDDKVYFVVFPYSRYKDYKSFLKNVLFINS